MCSAAPSCLKVLRLHPLPPDRRRGSLTSHASPAGAQGKDLALAEAWVGLTQPKKEHLGPLPAQLSRNLAATPQLWGWGFPARMPGLWLPVSIQSRERRRMLESPQRTTGPSAPGGPCTRSRAVFQLAPCVCLCVSEGRGDSGRCAPAGPICSNLTSQPRRLPFSPPFHAGLWLFRIKDEIT